MPIRKNGRNDYFSEDEPNVFDKIKKQGKKAVKNLFSKKSKFEKHFAEPSNDDLPGLYRMRPADGSSHSGEHKGKEAAHVIDHANDDLPSRHTLEQGSLSPRSGKRFSSWKARHP